MYTKERERERERMDSKFAESILSFGDTDVFNETLETASPVGGLSGPEETIAELEREMRLLNWHKVANDAALKAALIRTKKLKSTDKGALRRERLREKAMRMRQIIEEEQQKPLHLNADYVRRYEEQERDKEERLEKEVLRNINTLTRLRGSLAEREDTQKRYSTYRKKRKALERKYQSHGGFSTRREDFVKSQRKEEEEEVPEENNDTAKVFQSLDKLVQLEKRISVLETEANVMMKKRQNETKTLGSLSRSTVGWRKRRVGPTASEPSKTVYSTAGAAKRSMSRHKKNAHVETWLKKREAKKQARSRSLRKKNERLRERAEELQRRNSNSSKPNFQSLKKRYDRKRDEVKKTSRGGSSSSRSSSSHRDQFSNWDDAHRKQSSGSRSNSRRKIKSKEAWSSKTALLPDISVSSTKKRTARSAGRGGK